MPTFQDFFRLQINLDSSPTVASKFTIPLVLVDHADVPIDTRVRQVTPATWATRLTEDSEAYNWYERSYGQPFPVNPINSRDNIEGYVGRWVSAASAPYSVYQDAEDDYSVYAALLATSGFNIDDGTNDEDVAPDFTGDTDMDDVAASITAALAAGTDFTGHVCSVDVLNRLIITSDTTGAAADSFVISAPATGVDLSGVLYLGVATSFDQAGLDAETLGAAATAVFVKNNTPTVCFQRGADDTQKLAWLTAMDAIEGKFSVALTSNVDHEDSTKTDTLGYLSEALEFSKAHVIYTRQDDYADAAAYGENMPQKEGSVDYALNPLGTASLPLSASGLEVDLVTVAEVSAAAVEALDATKTDFVTTPDTVTHLARGLCPNGDEVRIVLCKMWAEYNVSREGYQFLVSNKVNTFTDIFIGGVRGIIEKYLDECVNRLVIEEGYTINLPSAAEFTAAQKASHAMSLPDIASAGIQFAVNSVFASMTWSAQ